MPTGLLSLGSQSLTFDSNRIQFNVQTTYKDAKQLLLDAYSLFDYDLKLLEGHKPNLDEMDNQIKNSGSDTANKQKNNANTRQNCDINKFIINAEIQTMADVYLHMDIDESYELNVTSEF